MQILGLLGMYFDAAVVFVTSHSLLFTLALAILCYEKLFFFLESQQLQNCRNCWKNFVPQWWYPNSDPSVQETLYLSNHYGPTFYTLAAPLSRQVFFSGHKKVDIWLTRSLRAPCESLSTQHLLFIQLFLIYNLSRSFYKQSFA